MFEEASQRKCALRVYARRARLAIEGRQCHKNALDDCNVVGC